MTLPLGWDPVKLGLEWTYNGYKIHPFADLRGAYLPGFPAAYKILTGIDFTGANLRGAVFTGAQLEPSGKKPGDGHGRWDDISPINILEYYNAYLRARRGYFGGRTERLSSMRRCELRNTRWDACYMEGLVLDGSRADHVVFGPERAGQNSFKGCHLEGISIPHGPPHKEDGRFSGSTWDGAHLKKANLSGHLHIGSSFRGINARRVNLSNCYFERGWHPLSAPDTNTDGSRALEITNFAGAYLVKSTFFHSRGTATFTRANIDGAFSIGPNDPYFPVDPDLPNGFKVDFRDWRYEGVVIGREPESGASDEMAGGRILTIP